VRSGEDDLTPAGLLEELADGDDEQQARLYTWSSFSSITAISTDRESERRSRLAAMVPPVPPPKMTTR
jgi:hypothetical protein